MHVESLAIAQFRCHAGVRTVIPDAGVRIVGPNGSGKTSILEAIGLLATTRSFRGASDRDLVRWDSGRDFGVAPFARVEATVQSGGQERRLSISIELADDGSAVQSKRFHVDERPASAHELVGNLMTVAFTPEDVQLVIGPPADRRRAIDVLISQFDRTYMRHLAAYGRVLKQRNGLLKAFARDRVRPDASAAAMQISFWDEQLVAEGGYLVARRARVIDELSRAMEQHAGRMSSVSFGVTYTPRVPLAAEVVSDVTFSDAVIRANRALQQDLERLRPDEFRRGMTLTGPHRDDLDYQIEGRSLARFGSRGQQRLAVLAIKLAEADVIAGEAGEMPVFLLDDILSELDPNHRSMLLDELASRQIQTILTSADDAVLEHPSLEALALYHTDVPGTSRVGQ